MKKGLLKFALGLPLLAACSGVKTLGSFPTRGAGTDGAVVFKYKAINDMPGVRPSVLVFKFAKVGQNKVYGAYRKVGKGFYEDLGAEVEELLLFSLPPGEYALEIATIAKTRGLGNTQVLMFHLDSPGGAFGKIVVEPRKVLSLGKLDLLVKIEETADAYNWKNSKVGWDDRDSTRKAVLREALEDGRTQKMKWGEMLEAAANP